MTFFFSSFVFPNSRSAFFFNRTLFILIRQELTFVFFKLNIYIPPLNKSLTMKNQSMCALIFHFLFNTLLLNTFFTKTYSPALVAHPKNASETFPVPSFLPYGNVLSKRVFIGMGCRVAVHNILEKILP